MSLGWGVSLGLSVPVGMGDGVWARFCVMCGVFGEGGGPAVAAVWFLEMRGLGAGLCLHRNLGFLKYFLVS